MKSALLLVALLALAGCADRLPINTDYLSQGQSSRVQYVVLHYTSTDLPHSLALLTGADVSSHYLIGDQPAPIIYRLVDEERRAWHAGESEWQGRTWLNASTIGIELVNPGYRTLADGSREWQPYPAQQIDLLILLLQDLVRRHQLPVDAIIGHSDVAPQRKVDPGPLFPWQRLADAGLIRWPSQTEVLRARPRHERQLPDAAWFQAQLGRVGYRVPMHGEWDEATRKVLAAFQMKYRPQCHDGLPDAESAALLEVLNAPLQ